MTKVLKVNEMVNQRRTDSNFSNNLDDAYEGKFRINDEIDAHEVYLYYGPNGDNGFYYFDKVMLEAKERGLDLIELTTHVYPPICIIDDYDLIFSHKKMPHEERLSRIDRVASGKRDRRR